MTVSLLAALALAPAALAGETDILVAPFQPLTLESKGISTLLHVYLEPRLDGDPDLRVVPVDEAGVVFDQSAALYLDSCPPDDQVGCAIVVAEANQIPFAVAGTVQAEDEGTSAHVWVIDVNNMRQVDFPWALNGDDDALARQITDQMNALIRGEVGVPVDARFQKKGPSEDELARQSQRDQDAAELEAEGSQVRRLGKRQQTELVQQKLTTADIADQMEGDSVSPWERLGMGPREYLRYKNSGMSLLTWRERSAGHKGQVLIRPTVGVLRGPVDAEYYGRYERSASTLQVVEGYAWQAPMTASGPTLGLSAGYGVLPGVEVGLCFGEALGTFVADISALTEGDPVRERDPQTYSAWSTTAGVVVLGSFLQTANIRPVVGGHLLIWRSSAVQDHVLPPDELATFDAPMMGLAGVVLGVEARLGPHLDAFAHVPVDAVVFGGDPTVQHDGDGYLPTLVDPPSLSPAGAGLLLGVQVRLLGPREEKKSLDDYQDL